jgi:hypothetical protein
MNSIKISILSVISLTSLVLLFSACSKNKTLEFGKDPIYLHNLQYTKIGKIIKKNEVESLINVTYLNSTDSSKWNNNKQNFLVGIYMTNENNTNYKLSMNNQSPISIEEVIKDNIMYKNIALRNYWADYNIVSFKNTKNKKIVFTYIYSNDNNVSLSFDKE